MITCKNHPRYKGVRKSTTGCVKCRLIFGLRRIASACGFAAAQAAPRKPKEFPGLIEGVDSHPVRYENDGVTNYEASLPVGAAQDEYESFLHIGGALHGRTIYFRGGLAPVIYDGYSLTRFAAGFRAYVFANISYPFAERYLEQYRTTGHMNPCVDQSLPPSRPDDSNHDDFIFIGGKRHGDVTSLRVCDDGDGPCIYEEYFLTRFADGSRAYVFPDIDYATAQQHLEQYAATGKMSPRALAQHDFGKPLPRYEKFLFVGGPANLQIRKVGESHDSNGARPCELTMPDDPNIYIYRMKVIDWTSNPYPVAFVLDGISDAELATQLEAYRSLGPLDSGGKLC